MAMELQYEKIGKVTSASVFKATKKTWDQWIAILDKAGARTWTHQEIVAFLTKQYKLGPWWQQGVTLGFEIAIGRRGEGQDLKGKYMVTTTKSFPIDAKQVWKALVSEEGQKIWLRPMYEVLIKPGALFETEDGYFGEIRTTKKDSKVRMSWSSPDWDHKTTLEALIVPKPKGKSILCFNHTQLRDVKTQGKMRVRWKKAVAEFAQMACAEAAADI